MRAREDERSAPGQIRSTKAPSIDFPDEGDAVKQQPRPTISETQFEEWREANPEPAPDLPMLRKVLSSIDADPTQWDQKKWGHFVQDQSDEWSCGTARCVAGWAATFSPTLVMQANYCGVSVSVENTGAYALGLTSSEAWDLFEGTLTVGDAGADGVAIREEQRRNIQVVAELIAARAGEVL